MANRILVIEVDETQAQTIEQLGRVMGFESIEALILNLLDRLEQFVDHPQSIWRFL